MGMRSTQRSESLHGVIEGLVSTKLSLTELFYVLDYIKEMQNIKQQRAVEKNFFLLARAPDNTLSSLVQELIKSLNVYAGQIIRTQAHQISKYVCVPNLDGVKDSFYDNEHTVSFMNLKQRKKP